MATSGFNITSLDTRGTYYRNRGSRGAAWGLGEHDKRQIARRAPEPPKSRYLAVGILKFEKQTRDLKSHANLGSKWLRGIYLVDQSGLFGRLGMIWVCFGRYLAVRILKSEKRASEMGSWQDFRCRAASTPEKHGCIKSSNQQFTHQQPQG